MCKGKRMKKLVSSIGDSEITIKGEVKAGIKVTVTRRVIDRNSGEVKIVKNDRLVPRDLWKYFASAYEPSTT